MNKSETQSMYVFDLREIDGEQYVRYSDFENYRKTRDYRIKELEEIIKRHNFKDTEDILNENNNLKKQVADLESELSVKENLLKIRNSVNECQDAVGFLLHSEPISVAKQLINANYERKLSDLEKSLRKATGCDCETTVETVYSVLDLRQIAEHLLVYCNHNSEGKEE